MSTTPLVVSTDVSVDSPQNHLMSQTLNYMVKVIQHAEQLKCRSWCLAYVCGKTVVVVSISGLPTKFIWYVSKS